MGNRFHYGLLVYKQAVKNMARNMQYRAAVLQPYCEKTMNVMTRLLNALAFANIGNQNEFSVLLRQVDSSSALQLAPAPCGPVSTRSDTSSTAPGIQHAQGAL